MSFLRELWRFLRVRKKYLPPVLIMMVVLGRVIVLATGSVIAPFIYALF